MLPDLQINDLIRLRKPHPCGGYEWKVTRLGADIGLECLTCGHRVMLTRRELTRRTKTVVRPGSAIPGALSNSKQEPETNPGDDHANTK